ncbi:hypothetical protein [Streptomyces viridochromogenes]|uniref:Uncharacterized protein n=1 Tax=Streptomyces viridochromogenes Tue57 TaxID=1160705 RepID=L8PQU1_STRVR|nr:hypothetical protein [Streptomyces viridochromogenes]ELS58875.1 hypothetical protein STVIR_0128 [Streptomyces viridochromogenes Tue57]
MPVISRDGLVGEIFFESSAGAGVAVEVAADQAGLGALTQQLGGVLRRELGKRLAERWLSLLVLPGALYLAVATKP